MAPNLREKHLFRLAYGVLALLFWLSVAGFAYLMTRPHHSKTQQWSTWKPAHGSLDGAREIARRISRRYKLETGRQLVAVQEHPPEIEGLALEAIGIRRQRENGLIDPYVALFRGHKTLLYAFCGLGRNCAIPGGTSEQRELLLRREALELSLYTFKYLDGVDQVVSLLPPSENSTRGTNAVFLRRDNVEPLLRHPLREVLPHDSPLSPDSIDRREANVVDAVTARRTFPAQFEQLPDGDAILVLQLDAGS